MKVLMLDVCKSYYEMLTVLEINFVDVTKLFSKFVLLFALVIQRAVARITYVHAWRETLQETISFP